MSSSVFIEKCTDSKSGLSADSKLSDSNLVIVYGKNGINIDSDGVGKLMEDKALSSISVVRITSPTPSMQDEETESYKQTLRKEKVGSDNESEDSSKKISDQDKQDVESDYRNYSDNDNKTSDEKEKTVVESVRKKKKIRSNNKACSNKLQTQSKYKVKENVRPEIVGLVLENYFTSQAATEMGKEALKTAGVPSYKKSANHEFQLFVIRNDHCYTPFTSPTQMREKLESARLESEKQHTNRKFYLHGNVLKKKPIQVLNVEPKKNVTKVIKTNEVKQNSSEEINEDSNIQISIEEKDEDSKSIESVESENDRVSDVDFDVRNRKSRIRKISLLKKIKTQKYLNKRRLPNQEKVNNDTDQKSLLKFQTKVIKTANNDQSNSMTSLTVASKQISTSSESIPKSQKVISQTQKQKNILTSPVSAKQNENKIPIQQATIAAVARKGPILQVGTPTSSRTFSSHSNHGVKEIFLNKVMASPKGGFTDISALLTQSENVETVLNTPTSSRTPKQSLSTPKGFMPLGIETAARNQLPAQISIQTHQSSSELAAEHEKQLDLIDSIVKHEMQKPVEIQNIQPACIENIPELVKMLESTEKALEVNTQELNNLNSNPNIGNINITNTSILDAPVEDIPEDLLQDVVKLIEDDKTLKEAVDKQVFGHSNNNPVDSIVSTMSSTPPPLTPILHKNVKLNCNLMQMHRSTNIAECTKPLEHTEPRSIIEMTISNKSGVVTSAILPIQSTIEEKITPTVRKEPIKIIRGNGRVITLPPMEAPTTRAKLRAQYYPGEQTSNLSPKPNNSKESFQEPTTPTIIQKVIDSVTTDTKMSTEKKGTSKESPSPSITNKSAKRTSGRRSTSTKIQAKKIDIVSDNDSDNEDDDDDDDPKKLWCICRQPHNNRFMICCDVCEDWFHGTCVSITKAMGLDMEQKGIDWTCPKCTQKKIDDKQMKITDMLVRKPMISNSVEGEVDVVHGELSNTAAENLEVKTITVLNIKNETPVTKKQVDVINIINTDIPHSKTPTTLTQQKTIITKPIDVLHYANTSNKTSPQVQPKIHKYILSKPVNVQKKEAQNICIVCNRLSRINTNFCSDDCIQKHVKNYLDANITDPQAQHLAVERKKKVKELFEDQLAMIDRKSKVERVRVFDRKNGRVLAGNNAPTTLNIRKWLQENPTYEIVLPGNFESTEMQRNRFETNVHATNSSASKIKTPNPMLVRQLSTSPVLALNTHIQIQEAEHASSSSKIKKSVEHSKISPKSSTTTNSKSTLNKSKVSKIVKMKDEKTRERLVKRRSSESSNKLSMDDPELVRFNVRKTLKEQLLQRMTELKKNNEQDNLLMTPEEVDVFFTKTEAEMFDCFKHEISTKYKSKYRSLMFNIRDRKNLTLISKICTKQIDPKQFVKMSADELASQELAQWRENEVKHQLEMIKKSELDLLKCNKNYVLKTHKGEEVIEGSQLQCENLEITDVVSILKDSADETPTYNLLKTHTTDVIESKSLNNAGSTTSSDRIGDLQIINDDRNNFGDYEGKFTSETGGIQKSDSSKISIKEKSKIHIRDREQGHDRKHQHDRSTSLEKKFKNKDHHKNKAHSRKRSRSRSTSGSHSREKRHRSSHKNDKREKEERLREKDILKSHERKEEVLENPMDGISNSKLNNKIHKEKPKKLTTSNSLEEFNLIDKIIESSKTIEQAANISIVKEPVHNDLFSDKPLVDETQIKSNNQTFSEVIDIEIDDESTSTTISPPQDPYVQYSAIKTSSRNSPIMWAGNINMIDVASFQIIIQPVVGNAINLGKFLPKELDVVGRIDPNTVWDYISKIKKSPNKEIVIIRILPTCESETSAYTILYQYLEKRNRLGVIKTTAPQIKDFYIIPLECGKQLPDIIRPVEDNDFFADSKRPDMLIGVIIRIIGKRTIISSIDQHAPMKRKMHDSDSFTPPGSPKRKLKHNTSIKKSDDYDIDAIIKAPIIAKAASQKISIFSTTANKNDDEPYSPSDDELNVNDLEQTRNVSFDRKMEELNRQIAKHQIEIDGLLTGKSTQFAVSPHPASTQLLANISIPSNLPQILASIKSKPETQPINTQNTQKIHPFKISNQFSSVNVNVNVNDEYDPADAISPITYQNLQYVEKPTSRLAQLSEAELLRMVPDDMIDKASIPLPSKVTSNLTYDEPPPPGV
ncbi:uncharacterized protein LOC119685630 [Teleopsis dalmanni]|uniref:uncharacterized protein LOC119685630 n=1 Tax=Teleopsis dalmanni TaxID=139649 RepID=UPI0018CFD5D6|nr:uncharacterized protein LOC119685630 [Teleopsis dalmanni]